VVGWLAILMRSTVNTFCFFVSSLRRGISNLLVSLICPISREDESKFICCTFLTSKSAVPLSSLPHLYLLSYHIVSRIHFLTHLRTRDQPRLPTLAYN
jgi:hypothetical protein